MSWTRVWFSLIWRENGEFNLMRFYQLPKVDKIIHSAPRTQESVCHVKQSCKFTFSRLVLWKSGLFSGKFNFRSHFLLVAVLSSFTVYTEDVAKNFNYFNKRIHKTGNPTTIAETFYQWFGIRIRTPLLSHFSVISWEEKKLQIFHHDFQLTPLYETYVYDCMQLHHLP